MIINKTRNTNDYNIKSSLLTDGSINATTTTDILNVYSYILATEYKNISTKNVVKITNANPQIHLIQNDITRSVAPSSNNWTQGLQFRDANNVLFGAVEHGYKSNRENRLNLIVYNGTTTDTSNNVQISCGYDANGKWFTYSRTPEDIKDNSTKIATTEFIKSYLSSKDFINNFNTTIINNGGISSRSLGTTWVLGATKGYSIISSDPASNSFGTVFNAKTKTYRVALGTWPGGSDANCENVYLYSVSDANISAKNNSVAKSLIWNAKTGELNTNGNKLVVSGNHGSIGTGIIINNGPQNYAISIQNTSMTKGTKPTKVLYSGIDFYGTKMSEFTDRYALLQQTLDTNNANTIGIYAYDPRSSVNKHASIRVQMNASGAKIVSVDADLPANTDKTTKVATTQFVQNALDSRLSNTTPKVTGRDAAAVGTSTKFARADHSHEFKLPSKDSQAFKDLMKEMIDKLHLQYYIGDPGIDRNFYVSAAKGNDNNDGRTKAKPFKTISKAIDVITKEYNINSNEVVIHIAKGTYNAISCPQYTRTSGSILLTACKDESFNASTTYNDVIIQATASDSSVAALTIGYSALYMFKNITFKLTQGKDNHKTATRFPSIVTLNASATATFYNCRFWLIDNATYNSGYTARPNIRCIKTTSGSLLRFSEGGRFIINKTNSYVVVFYNEDGSTMQMFKNNTFSKTCYFVYGKFDLFYGGLTGAMIRQHGSATYSPRFVEVKNSTAVKYQPSCVGKRYSISTGAGCNVWSTKMTDNGTEPNNTTLDKYHFFPGSTDGSINDSSAWYI